MARQPTSTPEQPTRPVRLDFPAERHQELRVLAAQAGQSMAEYAREAVLQRMDREQKKSGKSV